MAGSLDTEGEPEDPPGANGSAPAESSREASGEGSGPPGPPGRGTRMGKMEESEENKKRNAVTKYIFPNS